MPQTTTGQASAPRGHHILGLTAVGAAAALTLSGCGSRVPPLEDVWPEVSRSIQDAQSVSVSRTGSQDGQDMSVDIAGKIDDSSYAGSISVGEAHVDVVGNQETMYLKPNEAFFEQLGGAALDGQVGETLRDLVGERWIKAPAEEGGFTMSAFWSSFSEELPDADTFVNSEYTSEVVTHDDAEIHKYSRTTAADGEPASLYITPEGHLLRVEFQAADPGGGGRTESASESPELGSPSGFPSGSETGTEAIEFSDWNAVAPVEMPADQDVISIPAL